MNDFIDYDEAYELKILGFNEPCVKQWTYMPDLIWCTNGYMHTVEKTNDESWSDSGGDCISAPTYSQAFKWFRDYHSLYHNVIRGYGWDGMVMNTKSEQILWRDGTYNTYEDAEKDCLKELIKIVKEKS